jgi:hypothetical protein
MTLLGKYDMQQNSNSWVQFLYRRKMKDESGGVLPTPLLFLSILSPPVSILNSLIPLSDMNSRHLSNSHSAPISEPLPSLGERGFGQPCKLNYHCSCGLCDIYVWKCMYPDFLSSYEQKGDVKYCIYGPYIACSGGGVCWLGWEVVHEGSGGFDSSLNGLSRMEDDH